MRSRLLISVMVATMLLSQPLALAQPLTPGLQPKILLVAQDANQNEEQNSNVAEWQKKIQQLQIASSQLVGEVVPSESIKNFKISDIQSKLPNSG